MIPNDPALTFALTLKRWFASNGWPQKITDDWAHDVGNATGPWASQVCNAMKASGYNPKAEFFLALATFNQMVASQELLAIKDAKLKDRLTGAQPLCLENGQPYGGAEFWSLYAGLIEPPEAFAKKDQITQEDVDEWVAIQRDNFRQVSLKHMVSRAEAWDMLRDKLIEITVEVGNPLPHDDIQWIQEILSGLVDPHLDEAVRRAQRWQDIKPLPLAFGELLVGYAKEDRSERLRDKASKSKSQPLFAELI